MLDEIHLYFLVHGCIDKGFCLLGHETGGILLDIQFYGLFIWILTFLSGLNILISVLLVEYW